MKPKPFDPTVRHLVYIYTLIVPTVDSETLYKLWTRHPMFKDYDRPSVRTIQRWRQEFKAEPKKRKKEWIKI